jgi:hypothetical protein
MGCDIHMYVEYADKKRLEETRKKKAEGDTAAHEYWRTFGSRINPGRNYSMFGMLSQGVRSDFPNGLVPKGMLSHDEMGYHAADDAYVYIVDDGSKVGDNQVSLEQAQKWASGRWPETIIYRNGKPTFVSHPDWHSHSWLTVEEFETALENYKGLSKDISWGEPIEYKALLAAMKALESTGDYVARVVFWFDN